MKPQPSTPFQQRGAIALLLILILAVSATSYFLVKQLSGRSAELERDRVTAAALAQAKAALIGYAASDPNRPGELPCPDIDDDGKITVGGADTHGSNCATPIGRLPWYTLNMPDLRDGYGERLWYALSDNFHANGSGSLNSTTAGSLTITGDSSANGVIAIVFSPGPALGNQSRDGDTSDIHSNINNVQNYLEDENANGDDVYISSRPSGTFNDKLLPIMHNDLFSVVEKRVLGELANSLKAFYADPHHGGYYPWGYSNGHPASNVTTGQVPYNAPHLAIPNWFTGNDWQALVTYTVSTNFQPGTIYPQQCGSNGTGCLLVNGYNQSQAAVSINSHSTIVCTTNPVVISCP